LDVIIDVMVANIEMNVEAVGCAAEALANLIIGKLDLRRRHEIINVVMTGLALYGSEHADAALHCLRVLRNLAVSATYQEELAEMGGLDAAVAVLWCHEAAGVRMHACAAIWNIATLPRNRRIAIEKDCIPALLMALARSSSNLASDENKELCMTACGALWTLLALDDLHTEHCTPEVVQAAIETLAKDPSSQFLAHLMASLNRKEDPRVLDARQRGLCSMVAVPRCKQQCGAERQRYCHGEVSCCAVQ
jgi:hypothetical protein